MSAFIDQFGEKNGLKYSICEKDFSDAMKGIGDAIAKRLQNLCVNEKLYDTDLDPNNASLADVVADCRVVYRTRETDPVTKQAVYKEDTKSMKKCPQADEDCWQLTIDKKKCEANGQLIQIVRTAAHIAESPTLPEGTQVGMQCRTCPDANTVELLDHESETYKACSYKPF